MGLLEIQKKSDFCGDLFWFLWKNQKIKKIEFLVFLLNQDKSPTRQNQNKSLQKPLYTNFGLTYIDVFFDEESESDVIIKKMDP